MYWYCIILFVFFSGETPHTTIFHSFRNITITGEALMPLYEYIVPKFSKHLYIVLLSIQFLMQFDIAECSIYWKNINTIL